MQLHHKCTFLLLKKSLPLMSFMVSKGQVTWLLYVPEQFMDLKQGMSHCSIYVIEENYVGHRVSSFSMQRYPAALHYFPLSPGTSQRGGERRGWVGKPPPSVKAGRMVGVCSLYIDHGRYKHAVLLHSMPVSKSVMTADVNWHRLATMLSIISLLSGGRVQAGSTR